MRRNVSFADHSKMPFADDATPPRPVSMASGVSTTHPPGSIQEGHALPRATARQQSGVLSRSPSPSPHGRCELRHSSCTARHRSRVGMLNQCCCIAGPMKQLVSCPPCEVFLWRLLVVDTGACACSRSKWTGVQHQMHATSQLSGMLSTRSTRSTPFSTPFAAAPVPPAAAAIGHPLDGEGVPREQQHGVTLCADGQQIFTQACTRVLLLQTGYMDLRLPCKNCRCSFRLRDKPLLCALRWEKDSDWATLCR